MTFSNATVSRRWSDTRSESYADGYAHDIYVFDEHTSSSGSDATQVTNTTHVAGSYADLVFPLGLAIRVQSGTYDTMQKTRTAHRSESNGSKGFS